ncbi:MAG: DUF4194 domain-containing protein [Butyrivibrio sp.]
MQIEEYWDNFTSSERELFQKSCRRLLKQTFIVRDKDEENKKLYFFTSKQQEVFTKYLSLIGFDIIVDRDSGVVMLRNCAGTGAIGGLQVNHVSLKKAESIVLCCLWTLYADRLRSGSLQKNIMVSVTDLRFALEKYGLRDEIDKTMMNNILNLFSKYNLLDVCGKIGDPDCMIKLYASMQFALDGNEFEQFATDMEKRMTAKEGEEEDDDEIDTE